MSNHHRKPSSLGGTDAQDNISHPKPNKHQLWHSLFRNMTPEEIFKEINEVWIDPDYRIILERRVKMTNPVITMSCPFCGRETVLVCTNGTYDCHWCKKPVFKMNAEGRLEKTWNDIFYIAVGCEDYFFNNIAP